MGILGGLGLSAVHRLKFTYTAIAPERKAVRGASDNYNLTSTRC